LRRVLVTGCAGFIGSHLTERLLEGGASVLGIDSFTDYYDRSTKEANLSTARDFDDFRLVDVDILESDLNALVADVDTVFHLAAQPGVRESWGQQFDRYVRDNVQATQVLLEALRSNEAAKLVFASSSSVYGDSETGPTRESSPLRPISPYGVTKVAAEHLVRLYGQTGLRSTVLRYFTVYGPRQRPDMAFSRFIRAIRDGDELLVYGDGRQSRDFTFVADAVEATVLAAGEATGGVFNIGGGAGHELNHSIQLIGDALDRDPKVSFAEPARGDVRSTGADTSLAEEHLGFRPRVSLAEGIRLQVAAAISGKPRSLLA
jgi:UDP-glucose 4-epimerase